ncbi:MAG TPA: hypothetical protein VGQ35_08555 [Dongiaceae bacterium]|nr:hypothetical protein [Dongiaceae bacterium]
MFENYRVVCVTPAGRRRYMRLLVPQILASPLVDRYDIWVNTPDEGDLAFLRGVAELDSRVRLVAHPDGAAPRIESIGAFHRTAMDKDTIYVRLDDDVVWLEPGFFEALLRFRIAHPDYFLVMPLIINNALCSFLLQSFGKIKPTRPINAACMDEFGWRDPFLALDLHRLLIGLIRRGETARLHLPPREIALNRFSINSICWFGTDMAAIGGRIGEEEEADLSLNVPVRFGRRNCFCGDTIAAHYAFIFQRPKLERSGVLDEYRDVLAAQPELAGLLERVDQVNRAADAASANSYTQGLYAPGRPKFRKRFAVWWHVRPWRKEWRAKARVSAGPAL